MGVRSLASPKHGAARDFAGEPDRSDVQLNGWSPPVQPAPATRNPDASRVRARAGSQRVEGASRRARRTRQWRPSSRSSQTQTTACGCSPTRSVALLARSGLSFGQPIDRKAARRRRRRTRRRPEDERWAQTFGCTRVGLGRGPMARSATRESLDRSRRRTPGRRPARAVRPLARGSAGIPWSLGKPDRARRTAR